jgi:hypothetical protein
MSVRATITSLFEQVTRERQRKLLRLSDDLKPLKSGLDSLSFALIVAWLEDSLGTTHSTLLTAPGSRSLILYVSTKITRVSACWGCFERQQPCSPRAAVARRPR